MNWIRKMVIVILYDSHIVRVSHTAQLTILWFNLFGENHTPLLRNGMAVIPKN